ncbi:MAG TPA: FAD-binding oxidoreductase [Terracidiphilus sp.]|nr:FAD-binding oxidoreductase [Terracidiphilus sp.]
MSTTTTWTREECLAHLASIAGQEHTKLCGESVAVAAADAQQIAEILRFADASGIAVTPVGSGTKLDWGNPVEAGIRLDLKRMNALREHPWQDMTCTVEAGCNWAAMQAELSRHGQMVALDPLWPEEASVGGVVAANDGGALRLKYGGLRDLIIGMTIVLADGTIAKTGGKVVKNVAGYDLHKLMIGSFGTLGVITEVNFRLHPVEANVRTWTATAKDAAIFAEPLRALLDSQMTPSAVQVRVRKQECALDVRIAALPECMDDYAARLQKIFGQVELSESTENVWQARQELFSTEGAVVLKVSLLPSDVCPVSSELQQWTPREGTEISVLAQAAGLMTVALKSSPDAAIALIQHLRGRLHGSRGSVVALQVPEALRGGLDVWGCDSNALPLMREIKRRFDPNRILNPDRFVGNI